MVTHPTVEQIAKLPKWAQEYIKDINRERDTAVKELNDYCDSQTPSPVYIDELVSTGEQQGPSSKTRYIQTPRVQFDWQGVSLTVLLRDDHIDLQWNGLDRGRYGTSECAFIPRSYQSANLVSKANMR